MKLEKFERLKIQLEVLKLEKNFFTLNRVLYYFSFLGNIFLVYFGYFFIESITKNLPNLFPFQSLFLAIFIALFLTGYELTKRFVIEQLTISILQVKKITWAILTGFIIAVALIAGSFYLSLNGAHRLVDNTEIISTTVNNITQQKSDSIVKYYNTEIQYYRAQPGRTKSDRRYRDSIVTSLETAKENKLVQIATNVDNMSQTTIDRNKENDIAFVFMTFFLEFIVILGVCFNAIFLIGSYEETKALLATPRYKQLQSDLKLLKLYFQNGKKKSGDLALSNNKLISLVKNQKLYRTQTEIKSFIVLCIEIGITKELKNRKKEFQLNYEEAKKLIMKEELL